MNLPWTVKYVELRAGRLEDGAFPWLVLDCWGVVIARFDYEEQAKATVTAVNRVRKPS